MSTYIITYDLNKPGQDYSSILKKIKDLDYIMLSKSSYVVKTNLSASELWDRYFEPHVDKNDSFVILAASFPIAGRCDNSISQWLNKNLDRECAQRKGNLKIGPF